MRRLIYTVVGVLITLMIVSVGMYVQIERFGLICEPRQADTIIVLGAAVWRNGPSPALLERITLAEKLYRQGYAPVIITTGGSGDINPTPEGRAARQELIARGIPETDVYEETSSRNTRENFSGALALMQEQNWQSAIIVTHDFHLMRATREARRLGLEVSGAGVHETAMVRFPMVLREIAANLVAIVSI